jgi:hypothetical protein
MSYPQIQGHCPACGGTSLFVAEGGYITCSRIDCAEPDAVASILDDSEIAHVVEFREADFTIRHPLIERVDDRLMQCQLHADLVDLAGPPVQVGRYRAVPKDNSGPSISLADVRHPWDYMRLDGDGK